MQEDSRTYETMESCDNIATWLREPVVCFSNYGWKIQYDTNASTSLNLDMLTALEYVVK